MSTTAECSSGSAVPGSTAETPEAMGSALLATTPIPDPQHAPQDIPEPKCLDPNWIKEGVPDTRFHKDYPPDAWGQEAAPNARVWKIYRDELTAADTARLKSWNSTLDVLLIFAGLFSAVSTAFIIESYKSLQPDYTQYIANFLHTTVTSNLLVNGGIALPTVTSMGPPDNFVHPSRTQRWTNGLWFTSLVISLIVALLCIMIKQWLDQYHARTTGSAASFQTWARRHQIYYRGIHAWGVPALISLMPLLLHVSLFLFFAGLVLFLRPLDSAVANTLLTILIVTLLFYVLALIIPAWYIDCPSYTPLLAQTVFVITFGLGVLDKLSSPRWRHVLLARTRGRRPSLRAAVISCIRKAALRVLFWLDGLLIRSRHRFAQETSVIDARQFDLDGRALTTLLVSTNDPDIIDAGVEAIGAMTAEPTLEFIVRNVPAGLIDERTAHDAFNIDAASNAFTVMTQARRMRTFWVLVLERTQFTSLYEHRNLDLDPFLGLDGMMIRVMGESLHSCNSHMAAASLRQLLYAHVLELSHSIQTESQTSSRLASSTTFPIAGLNRATCLLFLRMIQCGRLDLGEHRIPCILLIFCAGDFAQAQSHERAFAMRIVLAALERVYELGAPPHNADDTLTTLDHLFAVLATHEKSSADDETDRLFAHHLGLQCTLSLPRQTLRWEQLTGFSTFVQSINYGQCVSRAGVKGYLKLLQCAKAPSYNDTQSFQQYWNCMAILLQQICQYGLISDINYWMAPALFDQVMELLCDTKRGSPFLNLISDAIFLKFVHIAKAIRSQADSTATWDNAERLSYLLCLRHRLRPCDQELVGCFFEGPLLTNHFRSVMRMMEFLAADCQYRPQITTLARHCARLSLDSMLRICDELEAPSDGNTTLGKGALALVGEIRRGLKTDGELRRECDTSCDCMPPPADTATWITRWRNRILGRIAGPESESAV